MLYVQSGLSFNAPNEKGKSMLHDYMGVSKRDKIVTILSSNMYVRVWIRSLSKHIL